ncbi:TPA: ATP synthase F1 subunit gamma [Candidatus Saccharibacteria bacterium]|nr:ATP synthase F1 subunit gamma [Candidatus Saccharibacteria bacterium]HRK41077.1 ATP synthase F1 subunit gamma [Candidatus Saccharibacteria bacterium]
MASTRQIKSRIRSVRSNRQITKAMELVAASKLRKAQERTLATRRFTDAAIEVLNALSATTDVARSPLYEVRPLKSRAIIVITSDRGLAGAYNANALKLLTKQLREDDAAKIATKVITIGRKGSSFVAKLRDVEATGSYHVDEDVSVDEVRPILLSVIEQFKSGDVDSVEVISTKFVNSFTQTAEMTNLLPAGTKDIEGMEKPRADMLFEPSPEEVLDYATTRLVEAHLYQAILDARASEHAMRRVAMKNASDNAAEIVDDLTLEMNKVRQAAITQELSEISAGVEAMK